MTNGYVLHQTENVHVLIEESYFGGQQHGRENSDVHFGHLNSHFSFRTNITESRVYLVRVID